MSLQLNYPERITVTYKKVDNGELSLDFYPPVTPHAQQHPSPGLVYFHGGGLVTGTKQSWLPEWLRRRTSEAGIAFISAEYRLLIPASAHDTSEDIKDVFTYLRSGVKIGGYSIDADNLGVAGSSGGGLCAYLAAIHVNPKPKVLLSIYGQGGDFLTPHYLVPKTKPFFFGGLDLLDPNDPVYAPYLHPAAYSNPRDWTWDSPSAYSVDGDSTFKPNPRDNFFHLYLQLGVYLDFYLRGNNSLALREQLANNKRGTDPRTELEKLIPEHHRSVFPQLNVSGLWPPTVLLHGTEDAAILVGESKHMQSLLAQAKVPVDLLIISGEDHGFDLAPDAETRFDSEFTKVLDVLKRHLCASIEARSC